MLEGFQSPHTSSEYLIGQWNTLEAFELDEIYMVELEGTKPTSQSFGFYVGSKVNNGNLIGYFVPKNTGGNKYTMIFTYNKEIDISKVMLYQYPPSTAGESTITDFKIYKLSKDGNILSQAGQDRLPLDTDGYNVIATEVTKKWEYGKRYYIRVKGTKPDSQNFSVYIDRGTTNKGAMSRIAGTDIYELTFTVSQWDINRNVDNIFSIYQTPNGTTGDCHIDEIIILETNEAVLPTGIEIVPSTIEVRVGEAYKSDYNLTPQDAENYGMNLLQWNSQIASNNTADPKNGIAGRGTSVGSFTSTFRSVADPSVETLVTVNVTE